MMVLLTIHTINEVTRDSVVSPVDLLTNKSKLAVFLYAMDNLYSVNLLIIKLSFD